jgi:hypothetical protein
MSERPSLPKGATKYVVGDKVMLSYFTVAQVGEVIDVTPTKVRLRFHNEGGGIREAWRKNTEVWTDGVMERLNMDRRKSHA